MGLGAIQRDKCAGHLVDGGGCQQHQPTWCHRTIQSKYIGIPGSPFRTYVLVHTDNITAKAYVSRHGDTRYSFLYEEAKTSMLWAESSEVHKSSARSGTRHLPSRWAESKSNEPSRVDTEQGAIPSDLSMIHQGRGGSLCHGSKLPSCKIHGQCKSLRQTS